MVVEVVPVVGEARRAVHRAAVGDHDENPSLFVTRFEPAAGPLDGFTVDSLPVEVELQEAGDRGAGIPVRRIGILDHQVANFVEASRVGRSPRADPVATGAPAVP